MLMFESEEERNKLIDKWKSLIINNCNMCNGTGYINTKPCTCFYKAKKSVEKEVSNIPLAAFEYNTPLKVDYNFDTYFNFIFSNIYKTKNLYLQGLSYSINTEVIGYIADNIIGVEHKITHKYYSIYYDIYENLIQLSLRSNIDKDARIKLNDIIQKPNVLIIDGLGLESGLNSQTMHNAKLLQLILKERMNRVKSTILCSSLTINNIQNIYNKEIVDFIVNYFDIIKPRG